MTDLIVISILAVVLGLAVGYIYKEKKSGAKCIGCPHSKTCASAKGGCCSCSCGERGKGES
ncbi:MAG: FeoB-associated Cys-rich membrane protein [Ruminococcaceae bacterium]|nr:FeoB-associated Cys-rich membrane protein [Oscillospiraceae bacterium]